MDTDNYAETKGWGLTAPYITMRMARVTRRDFDGNIHVVTTVNQTASKSIEDAVAPGAEKLMCSTRQEMMELSVTARRMQRLSTIIWRRRLSTATRQAP